MQKIISTILLFVLAACSENESYIQQMADEKIGNRDAVALFSLTTQSSMPIDDIHIYGFTSSGELHTHNYYPTSTSLANEMLPIDAMDYTFVALVNVGKDFTPPISNTQEAETVTLPNFILWLEEVKTDYKYLLSAMETLKIEKKQTARVHMDVKETTEALKFNTLRLALALPDGELPDFTATTTRTTPTEGYSLRATVEVYQEDEKLCFLRHSTILSGNTLDLNLPKGNYDLLLWTDYVPTSATKSHRTDHHYTTTQLTHITFNPSRTYTANTNSRDAHSLSFKATVDGEGMTQKTVVLERPLAKYQIIATDLERYRTFERINDYPPLEELTATISYDGFLPNAFDISTNKPVGSELAISYTTTLKETTPTTTTSTLGSDYLFVNGSQSLAYISITITNKHGETIAKVSGIEINYSRNHITTISGDFLTAGTTTTGIHIDTDWNDETDYDF